MSPSRLARLILIALLFSLPGAAAGVGLSTLRFEVREETGAAAVVTGGKVLIRIRDSGGAAASARARTIAGRLEKAARSGCGPDDLAIREAGQAIGIYARSELLCTITQTAAAASGSTPSGLAASWSANLREAFAGPYLSVVGPDDLPLDEPVALAVRGQPPDARPEVEPGDGLEGMVREDGRVVLTGRRLGPVELRIKRAGAELTVPFQVRLKAGRIDRPVTAVVTGRRPPREFVRDAVWSELYAAAERQPGVELEYRLPATIRLPDAAGGTVRVPARVILSGGGTIPVETVVGVNLLVTPWADEPAARLLVSNEPEKVETTRLLLRAKLVQGQRTRLLYHHKTVAATPLIYETRLLNTGDHPARVHVRDATFGPNGDEIYVGHQACLEYWRQRLAGHGYELVIPARTSWTFLSRAAPRQQIVSGIAELTWLDGGAVEVQMVATSGRSYRGPRAIVGRTAAPASEMFIFDRPQRTHTAVYRPGGMYAFINVGREPITSIRSTPLLGNYGVVYDIKVEFDNPADIERRFELVFSADGGVARGVLVIDGRLRETGLVRPTHQERLLEFAVPPGGKRRHRIRIMPQSGSNYPLRLVGRPYTRGWSGRGKP